MNKSYLLLIALAFMFASVHVMAQGVIQVYNTGNSGLASNTVNAVDSDSQGRIWVGTASGVSVYDDGSWTTYTTSNSGLLNNNIAALAVDDQDNVWVATMSGAGKYDGSSWVSYTAANSGLSTNMLRSLAIDNQGDPWFGTSGSGADHFNGSTFTNYNTTQGLAHDFVQGIAEDGQGNMWFGTSNGVSRRTPTGVWTTYDDSNGLQADVLNTNTLASDQAGNIWGGSSKGLSATGGGVIHFDHSSWTIIKSHNTGLVYNDVKAIVSDELNGIWIATDGGGVSYYDQAADAWATINASSGLPSNSCRTINTDGQGNIWVGTNSGLARLTPVEINNVNIQHVTCDTIMGSISITANAVRSPLYFSIDSGLTYSNTGQFDDLTPGQYHIVVTDSLAFVYHPQVVIDILPIKQVSIGQDTTICDDETITLDAGPGFLSYNWSNGLTQQSILIDGAALGIGDHQFYVSAIDSNMCQTSDTILITVSDCLNLQEKTCHVNISPNPVGNILNIHGNKRIKKIEIYTAEGQLAVKENQMAEKQTTISMEHLKPGMYFLRIRYTNNSTAAKTIIKK